MKTAADLVAAAKGEINEVSVEQVKAGLDQGEDFLLLDARSDMEWAAGHLPNATHADRGRLEFVVTQLVPELSTPIVVYCRSGGRSALAAQTLQNMGYSQVASMAGGYTAWQEYGFETQE